MDEARDLDIVEDLDDAAAKSREKTINKGWGGFSAWELNEYKKRMHGVYDQLASSFKKSSTPDSGAKFQQDAEGDVKIKILNVEKNDPTHSISDPSALQSQAEDSDIIKKAA